ncbi:MAG: hypothetical protein HY925_10135, partial [Elusimicrobia bacterium]|nr:hypothetical protein [Elusimicrobiota bacterium]
MKRNILAYSVLSALLSSAPSAFAQTLEALKESSGSRFGEGRGLPPGGDGVKGSFGGGNRPPVP